MADVNKILSALGLEPDNAGVWTPTGGWRRSDGAQVLESINPATGKVLAKVRCATPADYAQVIKDAQAAFKQWRDVPAPKRGEAVRLIGMALRAHKDALGSLVSLEMGKIKAEGDGEVQEMIDVADFAVGQARMLYGRSMQSERPQHRMYEQWQPLGVVAVVTAFNFPVAVWAWNAMLAAVCGNATVWKPSPKVPLTSLAVSHLADRLVRELGLPQVFELLPGA